MVVRISMDGGHRSNTPDRGEMHETPSKLRTCFKWAVGTGIAALAVTAGAEIAPSITNFLSTIFTAVSSDPGEVAVGVFAGMHMGIIPGAVLGLVGGLASKSPEPIVGGFLTGLVGGGLVGGYLSCQDVIGIHGAVAPHIDHVMISAKTAMDTFQNIMS
jgi:hypothetical protein